MRIWTWSAKLRIPLLVYFFLNIKHCVMFTMFLASQNCTPAFRNRFKSFATLDLRNMSTDSAIQHENWQKSLPKHLRDKINRRLDMDPSNPVGIMTHCIKAFFQGSNPNISYYTVPSLPISILENFDRLLVPYTHPSRSPTESFYITSNYANTYNYLLPEYNKHQIESLTPSEVNELSDKCGHDELLMPTHTTFYLPKLLSQGLTGATYSGQVWRKDSIDSLHYPVFHQMDGYRLFMNDDLDDCNIISDLKETMEKLIRYLFSKTKGHAISINWSDDTFPFTEPSFEMSVSIEGLPIEVLGCGLIKPQIIRHSLPRSFQSQNLPMPIGWAFGIGLERLCMALFGIPDVRLFWEKDKRFASQFADALKKDEFTQFVRYSHHPAVERDISFFLPHGHDDDIGKFQQRFIDLVKRIGGGLVESVQLYDRYQRVVDGQSRLSLCYRITYRDFQNLTNAQVNKLHARISDQLIRSLGITIR